MASTWPAARDAKRASAEGSGAAVRVDARLLVLERTQMGVDGRSLGATAKAQGGVGSWPVESPRSKFYVEWRILAIITQTSNTPPNSYGFVVDPTSNGSGWAIELGQWKWPESETWSLFQIANGPTKNCAPTPTTQPQSSSWIFNRP